MQKREYSVIRVIGLAVSSYLASASVMAGPPIAYDSWTESSGTISVDCPVGFKCMGDSSDNGMMQRIITDSNGDQYIHQVIAEFTANQGNMTLETFVFSSNGTAPSGIASKQHMYHNETAKNLDVLIYLNTGWANTGENVVQITQAKDTIENGNTNIYYTDSFTFYERRDTDTQEINGKYVNISQGQLGSTFFQSEGGFVTSQTDQYSFTIRQVSGVFNPTALVATLTSSGFQSTALDSDGAGPGTVSWNVGDDLRMAWWGQYCIGCSFFSANQSFQVLENLTSGSKIAGTRYGGNAPEAWPDPPFGPAPTLIQY